jgi:undecaprenyl-diphosphatase
LISWVRVFQQSKNPKADVLAYAPAATYVAKLAISLILGVVQGISEWLPISSKTQIMIASTYLLKLNFSQAYALGLFLEGGTFLAAVIYFRRELYGAILALFGRGGAQGRMLLKYLFVVTVVTAIIAIPIYKLISTLITGPAIGIPMIVLGAILLADWLLLRFSRGRHALSKTVADLSLADLVLIGIAQGISALPGISRSGTTVSAMLLLKVKPDEAFRLSFFALILASLGATLVTILFSPSEIGSVAGTLPALYIGIAMAVSTIVSLVFMDALIKFAKSSRVTTLIFILGIIAILSGLISLATGIGG